jgi:hypothetical protein
MRLFLIFAAIVACAISCGFANAQESLPAEEHRTSVSPDKQWAYKCVEYDGECSPEIVKARTTEIVLDLSKEPGVPGTWSTSAEVIWAPDSKRFAFNYSPPHAPHSRYQTIAIFELRDGKWVALPTVVDESSQRSQLVQLAKEHLPKNLRSRREGTHHDILKVRRWLDRDTAILYTYSLWDDNSEAAFLFTLKFDEAGNWKIVKTHQLSKKELEEEQ